MPANNINQPRAANNTIASKLVETVVTSEYEDNPIPIKPANKALAGRKLASVKDDLGKTQLTKDAEKLQVQLAAKASDHAKVSSDFQNLRIEVASLKESNLILQEEVTSKKKFLQESQKELELSKTLLNKEQQLRRQSEAEKKSEVASMAAEARGASASSA